MLEPNTDYEEMNLEDSPDIIISEEAPFIFKHVPEDFSPVFEVYWKTFQNLSVSSAAALATVVPSGLKAKCNTLLVWPLKSAIFLIVGYFQIDNWLLIKPCDDKISLS